jgi:hypothetical protein
MAISKIETASLDTGLVAPTATALTTASGSAPSYSARAWVNFNGIGTVAIRASGNVSSITDNGTGDYTVNFTTAMADANYSSCAVGARGNAAGFQSIVGPYGTSDNSVVQTTTSARFTSRDFATTATDVPYVGISIFR